MDKSYFIDEKTVVSKDNVLFKISDIVTIKDNKSPNYGKLLTILGFRWNKSETEICAITNIHTTSGIGIDKIRRIIDKEPNVEFIPGRWYKLTDVYKTYRKCSDHPIKNRLPYSELISGRGHQFSYGNCYDLKRLKLVEDLSEIQEYLPEGHVDKFCETCNGEGETMVGKLYPSGHREVTDTCPDCNGTGFTNNVDKITSDVFKKGEYIVLIGNGQSNADSLTVQTDSYIQNHCYKVRETDTFLMTELDSNGSTTNGWQCVPYNPNKFHKDRNWRYATQKEINEYERRGGPYNVDELKKTSIFTEIPQKELNTSEQVNFLPHLKNNKHKKILTINNIHSVDIQLKIKKKNVKF